MKKEKLVTLKEALPAMVRVFCSLAKGSKDVWNYAVKNDKCINHYIYFATEEYLRKFYRHEDDCFYTEMFRDVYLIVEKILREPIHKNVLDECIGIAYNRIETGWGGVELDEHRMEVVMQTVCYILESLEVRIKDRFYEHFMDDFKPRYGGFFGCDFYNLLSDRLSGIKDKYIWCDDEKKLSSKTEFEKNHEAWAEDFFGLCGSATGSSSANALPGTEPTSSPLPLSIPPFKNANDAAVWKERLIKFYGEDIHTQLNLSKYNKVLRSLVWFIEEWEQQGLLIRQPNRATIRFLVDTCGFKCDGVDKDRMAGVLGDLRRNTGDLCTEKDLVRKYMESLLENT